MNILITLRIATLSIVLAIAACSARTSDRDMTPEKRVTFYATYGYLRDDQWRIPMRIWVHEEPDAARRLLAVTGRDELMERAGLDEISRQEDERFMFRADGFIADSESNETVVFKFSDDPDDESFLIRNTEGKTTTDRNGLIEGVLTLPKARADQLLDAQRSSDGWLSLEAASQKHGGAGRVRLIEPTGISVISDIDDTIKVTDIPAGHAEVIKNTFFREFKAAPCMAEMYRDFGADAVFHYVSGGPWQLYQPLADFLTSGPAGFPPGSFHMKNVRTNLSESESFRDIWRLIDDGSKLATFEQKVAQISTLLQQFPRRTIVLIGDSGERDPEVFAEIKMRFPERISEIRIRDVLGDATLNPDRLRDMTIIRSEPDAAPRCTDILH